MMPNIGNGSPSTKEEDFLIDFPGVASSSTPFGGNFDKPIDSTDVDAEDPELLDFLKDEQIGDLEEFLKSEFSDELQSSGLLAEDAFSSSALEGCSNMNTSGLITPTVEDVEATLVSPSNSHTRSVRPPRRASLNFPIQKQDILSGDSLTEWACDEWDEHAMKDQERPQQQQPQVRLATPDVPTKPPHEYLHNIPNPTPTLDVKAGNANYITAENMHFALRNLKHRMKMSDMTRRHVAEANVVGISSPPSARPSRRNSLTSTLSLGNLNSSGAVRRGSLTESRQSRNEMVENNLGFCSGRRGSQRRRQSEDARTDAILLAAMQVQQWDGTDDDQDDAAVERVGTDNAPQPLGSDQYAAAWEYATGVGRSFEGGGGKVFSRSARRHSMTS